ncbi:MAG: hypothetical protein P4M08_04005 [Oligoflexia bacterium]|nr:hypothetical protein [Oligoflexia bacterium]
MPDRLMSWILGAAFALGLMPGAAARASTETITVDLPPSRLEAKVDQSGGSQPSPESWLNVGASSWAPGGFSLPSLIPSAPAFQSSGLPAFYVNYIVALAPASDWTLKFGANWLSLGRTVSIQNVGFASSESETIQLFSLRAGIEYAPISIATRYFSPYIGAALLPSIAIVPSSSFEDTGNIYGGIPLEFAAGSRFQLDPLSDALRGVEFDLAAVGTVGTVEHSSVGGIGISGGLRLSL